MSSLSKKILQRIEKKKMKPRSKWFFFCKHCSKWLVAIALVVLGSLAFTVFIFTLRNTASEVANSLYNNDLGGLVSVFPYLWLLLLLLVFAALYGHVRHVIEGGYKLHRRYIALGIVLASVVFGTFWYNFGFGMVLDNFAHRFVPGYSGVITVRERMWVEPENDRVAGRITRRSEKHIVLEDFTGKSWHVQTDEITEYQRVILELYGVVAIVGRQIDEVTFHSCYIYPWEVYGSMKEYVYKSSHLSPQQRYEFQEKLKNVKNSVSTEIKSEQRRSNKCKGIQLLGTSN